MLLVQQQWLQQQMQMVWLDWHVVAWASAQTCLPGDWLPQDSSKDATGPLVQRAGPRLVCGCTRRGGQLLGVWHHTNRGQLQALTLRCPNLYCGQRPTSITLFGHLLQIIRRRCPNLALQPASGHGGRQWNTGRLGPGHWLLRCSKPWKLPRNAHVHVCCHLNIKV